MKQPNQEQTQTKRKNWESIPSDMAKPLITTIIPTYRRPKLLRRAIKSVLNQTYPHLQVCVYDNASGDETANVVAEFSRKDSRVKYHCHVENIGALNNFNYGLKAVETPLFSFLSDDDILLPDFYQAAMEGFEKYPDAAFSGGATISMTERGRIRDVSPMWRSDVYSTPPEGLFNMLDDTLIWTSVLFRKEVIDEVGGLDLEVGPPIDLDFLLRIAVHFPFVISRIPAAIWLDHPDSYCARADSTFVWPGWLKMIRNLTEDDRIPFDVRSRAEEILTSQLKEKLFGIGSNSIRQKDFKDAYKVASILQGHYHQTAKANLIFLVAWCCVHLPLAYSVLMLINRVRKISRWNNSRNLQKRFGRYLRFINGDESSSKN